MTSVHPVGIRYMETEVYTYLGSFFSPTEKLLIYIFERKGEPYWSFYRNIASNSRPVYIAAHRLIVGDSGLDKPLIDESLRFYYDHKYRAAIEQLAKGS